MGDDVERIWRAMQDLSFCMLANWDGSKLHARPMGAFVRPGENAVYFFTDVRAHKDDEIARHPQVCLAFGHPGKQEYVSVSGTAEVIDDRAKIEELWSIPAKAWWHHADEPHIRLIKVTPHEAELWDSPGNILSGLRIAFGLVTGKPPRHDGEHAKARL